MHSSNNAFFEVEKYISLKFKFIPPNTLLVLLKTLENDPLSSFAKVVN